MHDSQRGNKTALAPPPLSNSSGGGAPFPQTVQDTPPDFRPSPQSKENKGAYSAMNMNETPGEHAPQSLPSRVTMIFHKTFHHRHPISTVPCNLQKQRSLERHD